MLLSLLFFFTLANGTNAQQVIEDPAGPVHTGPGYIMVCIVLMLISLTFVFAGKCVIKLILFIVGFIFFGLLSVWIASLIVNFGNISDSQMIGIILGSIIAGVIGGGLSFCLYQLGVVILGFIGGFALATLILSGVTSLNSYWASLGIIIAVGVIVGVITFIFKNLMIVITTSFIGSQALMIGVDAIANKGYSQFAQITPELQTVTMTPVLWSMLGSSIAITIVGIVFQYKVYPYYSYHNNVRC
jgi:hypothetical protein